MMKVKAGVHIEVLLRRFHCIRNSVANMKVYVLEAAETEHDTFRRQYACEQCNISIYLCY